MNIKDIDASVVHTKESAVVSAKNTTVETKPSSYGFDSTSNSPHNHLSDNSPKGHTDIQHSSPSFTSDTNIVVSGSALTEHPHTTSNKPQNALRSVSNSVTDGNRKTKFTNSNNATSAAVIPVVDTNNGKGSYKLQSTVRYIGNGTVRFVKNSAKRNVKRIVNVGVAKAMKNLEGSQEGSRVGYITAESVRVATKTTISSSSKSIKSIKQSKVSFRKAKNESQKMKAEFKAIADNRNKLKKMKAASSRQRKLTKNSIVKKQLKKEAAIRTKQASKALVKTLKYAIEALKKFIVFIGSSSVAFAVFMLCIALVAAIIASPFGIMVSNDDGSLTTVITEVMDDYHDDINNIMTNHAYDEIHISGSGPEWKDVLLIYIANYADATADEATVFAEFNDVNANKLSNIFWNMCAITYDFYNDPKTVVANNPDTGKLESVTVDNWVLNISISSSTANSHAATYGFSQSKLDLINEFSSSEYDQMWDTLLNGIPMYALLNFGDFPYYDQTDYGHIPYGDGSIADSGCGPTAFAMVASYLTGTQITPADVVSWCGNSFYVYGSGTSWGFFEAASNHYGITLERFTTDIDAAVEALAQGKPVINAQGAGRFTSGGHFIVLRGLDENGRILVYDPNNGDMDENNLSFSKAEISAGAGQEEYWIFTSDLVAGSNVARQVWNYFTRKGLSDEVTAGIIGNMMRECGGDTLNLDWDIYGSYMGQRYYGLCQWSLYYTPSIDGASVQQQCDHIWSTMRSTFNTYGSNYKSGFNYSQFTQLGIEEAAVAFAVCYERPGYENNNYQLRRQNARVAYNTFHR